MTTRIRRYVETDTGCGWPAFHSEDSATFFYNEKVRSAGNSSVLLHPGGKIMMRLHLFNICSKLAQYEQ